MPPTDLRRWTMENPAEGTEAKPTIEDKSFNDILKAMLGNVVTVVNPESYEEMPVGHQIKPGFYRAKLLTIGRDYLAVVSEFQHAGKAAKKEPVKQFIPLSRIKRISVMKAERLIHL
jgi:hypothetical protein